MIYYDDIFDQPAASTYRRTIKWIDERHQERILLSRVGPECPFDVIPVREMIQAYEAATGTLVCSE